MHKRLCICLLVLFGQAAFGQRFKDLSATPQPLPPDSTLVIGFLGGFEPWNDEHRGVRKLVLKLRQEPGVYAESISNRNQGLALKLIRKTKPARVVLFGQSLGGAAVVRTARKLNRRGIPVLLTAQVDSVGLHDGSIPPNVAAAVNFYQHDLFTIQGRREIHADDPRRTRILGNFGSSYLARDVPEENASWVRRTFGGSHAKMELDPITWENVERHILEAIRNR